MPSTPTARLLQVRSHAKKSIAPSAQYIFPSPAKVLVESIDKDGNQPALAAAALAAIKAADLSPRAAKPEAERVIKPLLARGAGEGQHRQVRAGRGHAAELVDALERDAGLFLQKNSLNEGMIFRFRAFAPFCLSCGLGRGRRERLLGLSLLGDNARAAARASSGAAGLPDRQEGLRRPRLEEARTLMLALARATLRSGGHESVLPAPAPM